MSTSMVGSVNCRFPDEFLQWSTRVHKRYPNNNSILNMYKSKDNHFTSTISLTSKACRLLFILHYFRKHKFLLTMKHKSFEWVLGMYNFSVKGNNRPSDCFEAVGVFFRKSANEKNRFYSFIAKFNSSQNELFLQS